MSPAKFCASSNASGITVSTDMASMSSAAIAVAAAITSAASRLKIAYPTKAATKTMKRESRTSARSALLSASLSVYPHNPAIPIHLFALYY